MEKGDKVRIREEVHFYAGKLGTVALYSPNDKGYQDVLVELEPLAAPKGTGFPYNCWFNAEQVEGV